MPSEDAANHIDGERKVEELQGKTDAKGNPKRHGIRYRVEYRDIETDKLIDGHDADGTRLDDLTNGKTGPAFDVVTSFRVRNPDSVGSVTKGDTTRAAAHITPSYHIDIYSSAIINAIQSVVQYYPQQNLAGDSVIIQWPYPILVHHYDELSKFREECALKDPNDLCIREKDACEHLRLLLEFLDEEVMEEVKAEQERIKKGRTTFEWGWVPYKPGSTILQAFNEDMVWRGYVVHSISGGSFVNPPKGWKITTWALCYDGTYLGRYFVDGYWNKFDGETELIKDTRFIDEKLLEVDECDDPMAKQLVQSGEMYWNLLKKQCRYYKGRTKTFPYNEVSAVIMVNAPHASTYDEDEAKQWMPHSGSRAPRLRDRTDLRNWNSDCTCSICRQPNRKHEKKTQPLFDGYNNITLEGWDDLNPHQYLLCPLEMPAFVFRTRTWEKLVVSQFQEPRYNENMLDNLVMAPPRVKTLKSLAKSYARINQCGKNMTREPWVADFVKGKGNGLIFLLHGKPGVGKTCTAECVAEFIKRPLMVLTCSDIGIGPKEVERNLTVNFKTAKSWGAVLLIDEADVFMERRSTTDLNRNSLVAGFLRALEFYDGILFLTTNRVGSFDDAFISRVHIQLYYPDFTDEERKQVWKTFTNKLAAERGDYIRLNINAKEYLESKQIRELKWNGREIRNAFQTAVALAEYEAQRDEESKIIITDEHLKAVVELSKDFKEYLTELHIGDEGKRAEQRYERLDNFNRKRE
ncbi:ATPase [Rhizodiscina lignyota]|uniref:ATPase n=1 Tax=Rhizodiscina lignyota TaxID=1504668 RepID=A0A9P4INE5_9PEZI|nr:ATPase [Rhizodiscina lignyota]